jgi:hypothetical protein
LPRLPGRVDATTSNLARSRRNSRRHSSKWRAASEQRRRLAQLIEAEALP